MLLVAVLDKTVEHRGNVLLFRNFEKNRVVAAVRIRFLIFKTITRPCFIPTCSYE